MPRMKRPSYREGVEWIALNDEAGYPEPWDVLTGYVSVALLADLFGVERGRVAMDIVRYRRDEAARAVAPPPPPG